VIVTPTNGQIFGGPAQVVPGGLLGLTGVLAPLSQPLDPINQVHFLARAGWANNAGDCG
jgi:hypothetical protein